MSTIKSIFPKNTDNDLANFNKMILQESAVKKVDNDISRKTFEDCSERTLKTEGGVVITHTPTDGFIGTFR